MNDYGLCKGTKHKPKKNQKLVCAVKKMYEPGGQIEIDGSFSDFSKAIYESIADSVELTTT